jgi:HK97 family phage major capsid protein
MFKKLLEKNAELAKKMQQLLDKAKAEERALTEEENAEFEKMEAEIASNNRTIAAEKRARDLKLEDDKDEKTEERAGEADKDEKPDIKAAEERAFEDYIRGIVSEDRADGVNLDTSSNGAVIPSSIANRIIERVVEICPIYQLADRYTTGGTLSIPYYDEESGKIEVAYATEFSELTSSAGKFLSIELKGFLAGALTKISKSLVNNSNFNITNFVVKKMSEAFAQWIEGELLNGTTDKIEGISKAKQVVTAEASTALTADELIDLQETVPDVYQPGAIWIMHKTTRTAIRKLKDKDGNYILNKDATARWGYTLFGKDVFCSDNMPKMEAGKKSVVYGDMSGLAVKVSEEMNLEVLREKYADQHALGVIGFVELDAKIENEQKIAVLEMNAA